MPVLDNLTTLIRKARSGVDAPVSGGTLLNIEALKTAPKLNLPIKTTSEEEDMHHALFEAGLYMARQDAWATLGDRIRTADAGRVTTPGGVPKRKSWPRARAQT